MIRKTRERVTDLNRAMCVDGGLIYTSLSIIFSQVMGKWMDDINASHHFLRFCLNAIRRNKNMHGTLTDSTDIPICNPVGCVNVKMNFAKKNTHTKKEKKEKTGEKKLADDTENSARV